MAYQRLDFPLLYGYQLPPTGAVNLAYISLQKMVLDEVVLTSAANKFTSTNTDSASATVHGVGYSYIIVSATGAQMADPGDINYYTSQKPADTDLVPSGFSFENVFNEIRVDGITEDGTFGWHPVVRDGLFIRKYVVPSDENSGAWFKLFGGWTTGATLYLVYSIPEVVLTQAHIVTGDHYAKYRLKVRKEQASLASHNTLQLRNQGIYSVDRVVIRNLATTGADNYYVDTEVLASGSSSGISAIDATRGLVVLKRSLSPDDLVLVDYIYTEHRIVYRGFRTYETKLWMGLDLNPQPGHIYTDPDTSGDTLIPSSGLAGKVVYLYLLPSAVYAVTGNRLYVMSSQMSGYYPVLRHEIVARDYANIGGEMSTFGYAHFGQNHFTGALPGVYRGGTKRWPCCLLLAKFYMGTSSTADNVNVIDTRTRGGGMPIGYDPAEVSASGKLCLDTYWDNSGWSGSPVLLDGNVVFDVPITAVTGNYLTREIVEERIKAYIAAGINFNVRYVDK